MTKRKAKLQKLLKLFETKLSQKTKILEQKFGKELNRLHTKRLKQYDNLMTKYRRCKNLLAEVNARESHIFKTQKRDFKMRNDFPKVKFKRKVKSAFGSRREVKAWSIHSDEIIIPEEIKLDETIRDKATGQTLMSIAQSVISRQKELLRRKTTIYDGLMKGIEESDEDLYSKME